MALLGLEFQFVKYPKYLVVKRSGSRDDAYKRIMTNEKEKLVRAVCPTRKIICILTKNHGLEKHCSSVGQFVRSEAVERRTLK